MVQCILEMPVVPVWHAPACIHLNLAQMLHVRDQLIFFSELSRKSIVCAQLYAECQLKKTGLIAHARFNRTATELVARAHCKREIRHFFELGKQFRGIQDDVLDTCNTLIEPCVRFHHPHMLTTFEKISCDSQTNTKLSFPLNNDSRVTAMSDFHIKFNNRSSNPFCRVALFIGGLPVAIINRLDQFDAIRRLDNTQHPDMVPFIMGIGFEMLNIADIFVHQMCLVIETEPNCNLELFANVHRTTSVRSRSTLGEYLPFQNYRVAVSETLENIVCGNQYVQKILLDFSHPTFCIQLRGLNIDLVSEVSIRVNGCVVFNVILNKYTRDLFQKNGTDFSISDDLSNPLYAKTVNLSRVDHFVIELHFQDEHHSEQNISVESTHLNIFRTLNGMGGRAFAY